MKQTLGVVGFLGLLVFWGMNASPAVDVRESAMEARGALQPLDAAPERPVGGGMANASAMAQPVVATADASQPDATADVSASSAAASANASRVAADASSSSAVAQTTVNRTSAA